MGHAGRWLSLFSAAICCVLGCVQATETVRPLALTPVPIQSLEQLNQQLLTAAENGNLLGVQQAIAAGANVNCADEQGFSVLVNAMAHYQVDLIEFLIVRGAVTRIHPNLMGPPGELAGSLEPSVRQALNEELLTAAESHDLAEVKRLLDAGADINAEDEDGFTVLVTALSSYELEVVDYLVQQGATIAAI